MSQNATLPAISIPFFDILQNYKKIGFGWMHLVCRQLFMV